MIRIVLPTRFIPRINVFYTDSYDRYLSRLRTGNLWADERHRRYTIRMYLSNIRKVLSVNGKNLERLDKSNGQLSSYAPWASLGYHSFCYEHWYFAYKEPFIAPDGKKYVEIQDIRYEGEFHNDKMDEPVYLQESQLRHIIRESIRKIIMS